RRRLVTVRPSSQGRDDAGQIERRIASKGIAPSAGELDSAVRRGPEALRRSHGVSTSAGVTAVIAGYWRKSWALKVRRCVSPWTVIAATSLASWPFLPTAGVEMTRRSQTPYIAGVSSRSTNRALRFASSVAASAAVFPSPLTFAG